MTAEPRWVKDGDSECYECGPFRAVITTTPMEESGIVAIRVRVVSRDVLESDDTPMYEQVAASGLGRRLEALKQEVERDLRARAGVTPAEDVWDDEPTTRTRTENTDARKSIGFYITRPPKR